MGVDEQRLWISGPMPGANELLSYRGRQALHYKEKGKGGKWDLYNQEKAKWAEKIGGACQRQGLQPCGPSYLTFFILEQNKKRDPDNFSFGAIKFILDALVTGKYLDNDGWKGILGFVTYWECEPELPGIGVFIRPDRVLTKEECNHGQREVDLG